MNHCITLHLELKQGRYSQTSNVNNGFGKGHKWKNQINKNKPLNQFTTNSTQ
jgi:hypothetical protein